MPYKHVLAAIDLSDESAQVLKKARATADSHKAKLSLINVVKPLSHAYRGLDMTVIAQGSDTVEAEAFKQASQQLADNAIMFRVDHADVHVKIGNPAHEIRDAASELEADLIVVGSHGRHGLGLLLGSTANAVLHGAGCDVLAVRMRVSE
jgi:universal stress protein A